MLLKSRAVTDGQNMHYCIEPLPVVYGCESVNSRHNLLLPSTANINLLRPTPVNQPFQHTSAPRSSYGKDIIRY